MLWKNQAMSYGLLLEMAIPKPYEIKLAHKGITKTGINKAWDRTEYVRQ